MIKGFLFSGTRPDFLISWDPGKSIKIVGFFGILRNAKIGPISTEPLKGLGSTGQHIWVFLISKPLEKLLWKTLFCQTLEIVPARKLAKPSQGANTARPQCATTIPYNQIQVTWVLYEKDSTGPLRLPGFLLYRLHRWSPTSTCDIREGIIIPLIPQAVYQAGNKTRWSCLIPQASTLSCQDGAHGPPSSTVCRWMAVCNSCILNTFEKSASPSQESHVSCEACAWMTASQGIALMPDRLSSYDHSQDHLLPPCFIQSKTTSSFHDD